VKVASLHLSFAPTVYTRRGVLYVLAQLVVTEGTIGQPTVRGGCEMAEQFDGAGIRAGFDAGAAP
jgi:hypothetical protein